MIIPKSYGQIVGLLHDAADGAHQYGVAIGLKQNTEPVIRGILESVVGTPAGPNNVPPAQPGLASLCDSAKRNKAKMAAALRSAISNGRALVIAAVNSLRPAFGSQWNSDWDAVGFTAGSLAAPEHPAALLLKMRAFYAVNPSRELKDMNGIACTAASCQTAADAITAAETVSNQADTDFLTAHTNLLTGLTSARTILSGLQTELGQLLDANDPRWLAFGLDMPGHTGSPEVPQNLTATTGVAGTVTLHCEHARRADGYRFTLTNAADGAPVASVTTQDPEHTFGELTSGMKVNVVVSARNSTGESQACAPVAVTVP